VRFHVDARFVPGQDPTGELAAEVEAVGRLRAAGVITLLLRRTDDSGAYLVMEAADEQALRSQIDRLPFARSGVMRFTVDAVELL
jgi:hypothetical protein